MVIFHKSERNVWLLAGLIILLSLASCHDDRLLPESGGEDGGVTAKAISFHATLVNEDVTSRGIPVNGPAYPDGESFGVLGYELPKGSWETTLTPDFMYNSKVTHFKNEYTYENTKLWPYQRVRFFAYHPYATTNNDIVPSAPDFAGDPYLQFNVKDNAINQIDLLLSVTDPLLAPPVVNFPFTHALTRIAFFVKKAPIPEEVKISAILVKNIIGAGRVSLVPRADGHFPWQPSSNPADVKEYVLGESSLGGIDRGLIPVEQQNITDTDYSPVCSPNGTLFLIPQPITSENSYLIVSYFLNDEERKQIIPLPTTSPGGANEWLSGKYIRYQLTITP